LKKSHNSSLVLSQSSYASMGGQSQHNFAAFGQSMENPRGRRGS